MRASNMRKKHIRLARGHKVVFQPHKGYRYVNTNVYIYAQLVDSIIMNAIINRETLQYVIYIIIEICLYFTH